MHLLDLIIYFISIGVIWKFLTEISNGQLTAKYDRGRAYLILILYTVIYVALFAVTPDWNWSDIIGGLSKPFKL